MRRAATRLAGAALVVTMTLGIAQAKDGPGLTTANFVDVGDGIMRSRAKALLARAN